MNELVLPPAPDTEAIARGCRQSHDALPLAAVWGCHVVEMCRAVLPAVEYVPFSTEESRVHRLVLAGLLLRCANLLYAMLDLVAHEDYGDAIQVLARSTSESALKLAWLCNGDEDRFTRFLADGLKVELELRDITNQNIAARGWALPIEQGLLDSIKKVLVLAGLSDSEIHAAQRMPDMAAIYQQIGANRHAYIANYKLGSQATHGTWLAIVINYLGFSSDGPALNVGRVAPDGGVLIESVTVVADALSALSITNLHALARESLTAAVARIHIGLHEARSIAFPDDYALINQSQNRPPAPNPDSAG